MNHNETVNMAWIAAQLADKGMDEQTVRRYFQKVITFLDMSRQDFKVGKDYSFETDLAAYIGWLVDQVDKPFLSKTLKGKQPTIEEVKEFYEEQMAYAETSDEPFRSQAKQLAEDLLMSHTQHLYEETMSRVKRAAELLQKLPIREQVEAILQTHPVLDTWIEELEKRVGQRKQKK
ncbi:hypothetical protein D478_22348 [Brevibacillus agri BAB-2500]|nr:hypothetical protein D478_22348 [Brevibacillus agri BAB-2500]